MQASTQPFQPDTEGVWFDLPADVYHAAPGVSQSTLKAFDEAGTPKHFKAAKPRVATEDMEFGSISHTAILQPEFLATAYHIPPTHYPAKGKKGEPDIEKPWHGGADFCKQWVKEHSDRPIIDREQESRLPKIVASVTKLEPFGSALKNGQREVSFFKRDELTGLLLKCRPDLIAHAQDGSTWLFDPKKVQPGEATEKAFQYAVLDYGYHIQAASYLSITGASGFVFVPFDDDEPFDSIQWPLSREFLELGMIEYRRILAAYARCVESNEWPGYRPGMAELPISRKGQARLKELQGA
ncbi:MAG: putative bacteriophage protein [Pedosphaera sp.]|nr:putative bacteriophage protein [Pedosphaera sp.]